MIQNKMEFSFLNTHAKSLDNYLKVTYKLKIGIFSQNNTKLMLYTEWPIFDAVSGIKGRSKLKAAAKGHRISGR